MNYLLNKQIIFFIFIIIFANFFFIKKSLAEISLIRDSQTEEFINEISQPIFKIAGLDSENIKIYLVNDSSINAFVMGGQNIFVNIGLIQKFSNPDVISGVIAHEVGHISGGHLAKGSEIYQQNLSTTIIGSILGIAAMATGQIDGGTAIILGATQINNRLSLKYSRSQEESADILAIEYLKKLQISSDGLLEIMNYFNQQSQGISQQINQFELTHPVSTSRILFIKNNKFVVKNNQKQHQKLTKKLSIIQAKLKAFLDNPEQNLKNINNNSYSELLAKSIIFHRLNRFDESLKILDNLIETDKNNGFLYELKGDFLFNQNLLSPAILNYQTAIKLLSKKSRTTSQIQMAVAILQITNDDKYLLNLAKNNLQQALKIEPDNLLIYKNLAIIYERLQEFSDAKLILAEYNYLLNDYETAKKLARQTIEILEKCLDCQKNKDYNSKILRAKDILEINKTNKLEH